MHRIASLSFDLSFVSLVFQIGWNGLLEAMAFLMSSVDPLHRMTASASEAESSTSSLATTTTSTTVFPPSGMRGVPQPQVSTKELIIIIFMFCFWAYSLFLTYRSSSLWKTVTLLPGPGTGCSTRMGTRGPVCGASSWTWWGRRERCKRIWRDKARWKTSFQNQRSAFQDREESEPLKEWEVEETSDRYETNNGNSYLPKKPIYTEVWFQYKKILVNMGLIITWTSHLTSSTEEGGR